MQKWEYRLARPEDASELLAIYAPYVEGTAITFEYVIPTAEEFAGRIRRTLEMYPYIVAERAGEIVGYAYTGRFRERAAFDWSVETSIYVQRDERGHGVGRRLYEILETISRMQHILRMEACIAYRDEEDEYLTHESVGFHARMGYAHIGRFPASGYKFGRWYDIVWMEKALGGCAEAPKPLTPFPQLSSAQRSVAGLGEDARIR